MTKEETYMGLPLSRFGDADGYVGKRLRNGDKRNCLYPENGIPKTTVKEGPAPTSADVFRFNKEEGK